MYFALYSKKGFLLLEATVCIFFVCIIAYCSAILTAKIMNNYTDQKKYRHALCLIEKHQETLRKNKKSLFFQEKINGIEFEITYNYQAKNLPCTLYANFIDNRIGDPLMLTCSTITISWINSRNLPAQITCVV